MLMVFMGVVFRQGPPGPPGPIGPVGQPGPAVSRNGLQLQVGFTCI